VFPLPRSSSWWRNTATPHHVAFTVRRRGSTGSVVSAKLATYESTRERMTKMAGNAQEIIALDRQRMTAMAKKDIATLNKIIADDLIYTHSSARTDTKKTLIGAMESGATVYTSVEPSEVVAQDFGDVVVLTGVAAISVNSGGTPNSFRVRFIDVYARRGGQWQMVTWQSTKLA
jgi:ketosteroid isomerase-like protein